MKTKFCMNKIARTDDFFAKPGGEGLWTKANAATSFDGFSESPAKKNSTGASQL